MVRTRYELWLATKDLTAEAALFIWMLAVASGSVIGGVVAAASDADRNEGLGIVLGTGLAAFLTFGLPAARVSSLAGRALNEHINKLTDRISR